MESVLKKIFKVSGYFSLIIWGGYLASMFFLQIHSNYEKRMFERIVENTIDHDMNDRQKILKLNELTHILLGPPRKLLLRPTEQEKGIVDKYLHSSVIALMGGYACYMHSQVFGSMIEAAGFDYRNFSMWKNGKNHNVAEVFYAGKWIVVDPLFNQVFLDLDGNLAGRDEIHQQWNYYQKQIGNASMFERDDYIYDLLYYDYTNPTKTVGLKSNLKNSIVFFWSKVLHYKSVDDLKVDMGLNKYLYWQIILSTLFLFWHFGLLTIWISTRKFIHEKN